MGETIEIYKYSKDKLLEIFSKKSVSEKQLIMSKNHLEYFDNYLLSRDIDVKTVLVENDYIDRDFLEDFAAYYVRCFTEYKRRCTRLHFFSTEFRQDRFDSFLENFDPDFKELLAENYLGFIVIKPLPETIIGRTCLKTYKEKTETGDKRVYPIVRDYDVNLCGITLTVRSLAFQEQDAVVSACATSALWSAFQGTGILFHHKMLSPVEITKTATKQFPLKERTFPNKGLDIEQMMHAIQELELEPFLVYINNNELVLKSYVYSYLTYGIPIILGIVLYDTDKKEIIGSHAVVITGYRLESNIKKSFNKNTLCLAASNMSRIYVHDDQAGPFSKMIMDGKKIKINLNGNRKTKHISLSTELKYDETPKGSIRAFPTTLLIPLYHKIRIPLENIMDIIRIFNSIVDDARKGNIPIDKFKWEICLTNISKFKEEILSLSGKVNNFKDILQKSMPRFLWRAKAFCKDMPVMELLFDATDIEQGHLFLCGVVYDSTLFSNIKQIIDSDKFVYDSYEKFPGVKPLIEWIASRDL